MRKLALFLAIWTTSLLSATAQTNDSTAAASGTQTILKLAKPQTYGLYIQPEYQYGQVAGALTGFTGSSLMFIVNQKFAIGATGSTQINRSFSPTGIAPLYLNSGFGGLKMEYTLAPKKAVHISFPIVLGGGYAKVDSFAFDERRGDENGRNHNHNDTMDVVRRNTQVAENNFLLGQVGVNVEANLVRGVKLYAGANYRLAFLPSGATATAPLTAQTLQGYSISAGVKVGVFEFNPKTCYNKMKSRAEQYQSRHEAREHHGRGRHKEDQKD